MTTRFDPSKHPRGNPANQGQFVGTVVDEPAAGTNALGGSAPLIPAGDPVTLNEFFVDEDGNCRHGMNPEYCAVCLGLDGRSAYSNGST